MLHIIVRPVIELGVETFQPPSNTLGEQFTREIQLRAASANYSKTPDGWFIPFDVVIDKIESLADYLYFEANHYGEFEVGGGFEIVAENGNSIGVCSGSIFKYAVGLAEAVINLQYENASCRAFIENDSYLDFSLNQEIVRITNGHIAKHVPSIELLVSVDELKQSMKNALRQLSQFVHLLELQMEKFSDGKFSSQIFRVQFGLER